MYKNDAYKHIITDNLFVIISKETSTLGGVSMARILDFAPKHAETKDEMQNEPMAEYRETQ